MTKTRSGLYVHVTWLAKIMSGDTTCQWSTWFKAHYDYTRKSSGFDLPAWLADHTRFADEIARERLALGEKCFRESQNNVRVKRKSGLVVSGRPDLVTIDNKDHYKVYDVKTGSQRQSDVIQLMLYILLLPMCPQCSGRVLDGCLIYESGERIEIPSSAIDTKFKDNVTYFLGLLESSEEPPKVPHPYECRFCDIGIQDCPDRMEFKESNEEPPELTL